MCKKNRIFARFLYMRMRKIIIVALVALALFGLGKLLFFPGYMTVKEDAQKQEYFIPSYASVDSVLSILQEDYSFSPLYFWNKQVKKQQLEQVHPGHYAFGDKVKFEEVVRSLKRGEQAPVKLTFTHTVRTPEQLAQRLSKQLLLDSASIADRMYDAEYMSRYGLTPQTAISLFLPDTYEVYWTISADELFNRMAREYKRFWTDERKTKAADKKLTQSEVATLASIVESETNNQKEYPTIASIYLNRLRLRIPLQACPTVIFAERDFGKRRVLKRDLEFDSPYNTYKHRGLPPGPIRCTRKSTMDAVLNAPKTDYLYMCANPDFSGTHVFTKSLKEHNRVSAAYQKELNKRHIK